MDSDKMRQMQEAMSKMTDEERRAFAAKMDEDLDKYMDK